MLCVPKTTLFVCGVGGRGVLRGCRVGGGGGVCGVGWVVEGVEGVREVSVGLVPSRAVVGLEEVDGVAVEALKEALRGVGYGAEVVVEESDCWDLREAGDVLGEKDADAEFARRFSEADIVAEGREL